MVYDLYRDFHKDLQDLYPNYTQFMCNMIEFKLTFNQSIDAIQRLIEILNERHGHRCIILIDEFDHCFQKITDMGILNSIIVLMEKLMRGIFSLKERIQFGFIVGILPSMTKELADSHIISHFGDITDDFCCESFGFTEDEVRDLIDRFYGDSVDFAKVRETYGGYSIGKANVFNPLSIMAFMEEPHFWSYWSDTGADIRGTILEHMDLRAVIALKQLSEGTIPYIESTISTSVPITKVMSTVAEPYEMYSFLAMTGYVSAEPTDRVINGKKIYRVKMVNKDARTAYGYLEEEGSYIKDCADSTIFAIKRKNPFVLREYLEPIIYKIDRCSHSSGFRDNTEISYCDYLEWNLSLTDPSSIGVTIQRHSPNEIKVDWTDDNMTAILHVKITTDVEIGLHSVAEEAYNDISETDRTLDGTICIGIGIRMKSVEVVFG